MPSPQQPSTLVRLVDPLSLYFRPGRNDHSKVAQVLSMGAAHFNGAVLEASLERRQRSLIGDLATAAIERVLDPMALELATEGGWHRPALQALPWGGDTLHTPAHVTKKGLSWISAAIAEFCVAKGYNAVIAPTHFLKEGVDDPWWSIDLRLAHSLRRHLDALGKQEVPIYYRLAIPRLVLTSKPHRDAIVDALQDVDVDALWLCLHPVDARQSGANVLKSYIDLSADLQRVGIPLVAERTGFLGTALLGFNAVGGIESGITMGESFHANRLTNWKPLPPDQKPFARGPRVYLPSLGVFLDPPVARKFFAKRGAKRRFACLDRSCCRTPEDMFTDPRRHLMFTRAAEVDRLLRVPAANRPLIYLETIRKASDDAVHAEKVDEQFAKDRQRLDGWRRALAGVVERGDHLRAPAIGPKGRIHHRKSA